MELLLLSGLLGPPYLTLLGSGSGSPSRVVGFLFCFVFLPASFVKQSGVFFWLILFCTELTNNLGKAGEKICQVLFLNTPLH